MGMCIKECCGRGGCAVGGVRRTENAEEGRSDETPNYRKVPPQRGN